MTSETALNSVMSAKLKKSRAVRKINANDYTPMEAASFLHSARSPPMAHATNVIPIKPQVFRDLVTHLNNDHPLGT
jgi:hypothetical protein